MRKRLLILLCGCVLLLPLSGCTGSAEKQTRAASTDSVAAQTKTETKPAAISFKLKDLANTEYSSETLFSKNKLTMINIWATFCGPCKRELPDLEKVFEETKDLDVNVIGIIGDTPDPENEEAAVKLIEANGVKYLNLVPNSGLKETLLSNIEGYPTIIFVDRNGNIVGEAVLGSRSKEEYKAIITELLKNLQ